MDIKDYILWGGGLLIALVLLHGLYLAWRSRRSGESDGASDYQEPRQTNLELGGTPPILMQSEPEDDQGKPSWLSEATSTAQPPADNAGTAMQTGSFASPLPDPADSQGDASRRLDIPGTRTEPTVPLASRPVENGVEPSTGQRSSPSAESLNDVVVIWVQAKPGATLGGRELLEAFTANNLEYAGDVFRKLDPNTRAERYQVVNGIEPGTFDLSEVDALATPRIVLLLRFNPYNDPSEAFEDMLAVAQDVADSLNGELKDENMSNMSIQTIEHCRQRIREYKRMSIRT